MYISPFEIYEEPVPREISDIPPLNGYVTFVGTNSTDRAVCMREAFRDNMLGSRESGSELGTTLANYRLLLQVFRIDDTETTMADFASAFGRILRASQNDIGPYIVDGWVAAVPNAPTDGHRTAYGFVLFDKPDFTLAEYSEKMVKTGGVEKLRESVYKSSPVVRDLANRIFTHGECWPGAVVDHNNIGLYLDSESGDPSHAVIIDWSSCVKGRAHPSRIITPLLARYKLFLDQLEEEDLGDTSRGKRIFFETLQSADSR